MADALDVGHRSAAEFHRDLRQRLGFLRGPRFALLYAAAYIDGVAPRLNPKESGPGNRKNGLKSKVFSGENEAAIIKAVNDWLAGETGIAVRDTQTRTDTDPATGAPRMTFEVWYDQA
ncbi:MAG: hypothetical protein V4630_19555 [Pseudomonadota bacterium]